MNEHRELLTFCRNCISHLETVKTENGFHEICKLKSGLEAVIIPNPWPKRGMYSVNCPN